MGYTYSYYADPSKQRYEEYRIMTIANSFLALFTLFAATTLIGYSIILLKRMVDTLNNNMLVVKDKYKLNPVAIWLHILLLIVILAISVLNLWYVFAGTGDNPSAQFRLGIVVCVCDASLGLMICFVCWTLANPPKIIRPTKNKCQSFVSERSSVTS